MPKSYRQPAKTLFFLLIIAAFTVATSWDYHHVYRLWNQWGIPTSLLVTFGLYAYAYFVFIPRVRKGISNAEIGLHILGISAAYTLSHYIISRFVITDEELLQSFFKYYPEKKPDLDEAYTQLVSGLLFFAPFQCAITSLLAYLHRQSNLGRKTKRRVVTHLKPSSSELLQLGWLILGWAIWLFLNVFPSLLKGKPFSWSTTLLMLLPSMLFFYINLKTSFILLSKNKIVIAVICSCFLWIALVICKGIWFFLIIHYFSFPPLLHGVNVTQELELASSNLGTPHQAGTIIGYIMVNTGTRELIILLASFIYGYGRRAVEYQQELRQLAENRQKELIRQKELEKELSDARLLSLRNQINPHFLFNSLNFLYAQALPLSDDLANSTMLLSKMMRYALQENGDEAKVPLNGEVEHIHNFIAFNQLRFSNKLQVQFEVSGQTAIRRIMPLLLITFVENAFKYGELHDNGHPLQIVLEVDARHLTFSVKNKKRKGPREQSTGIGLENVRRRLALGYPEKHTLAIVETDETYETTLTLAI